MMDWDKINALVEENGNVASISMETLRDALGKGKLGTQVLKDISDRLAKLGLGHIPEKLPNSQDEKVRLFKRGTEIGKTIEKILSPGEKNDQEIKDRLSTESSQFSEMVQQIREIVAV